MKNALFLLLICTFAAKAQLAVTVAAPKINAQKAVVELKMVNEFSQPIKSARAICFLLDEQGRMVGESAQWVIGGKKSRPALEPKKETSFNVIVTSPRPFTTTNLTAKVSFSRLIMENGKSVNPTKEVTIQDQLVSANQKLQTNQNTSTNSPNDSKTLDAVIAAAAASSPITIKQPGRTPETIAVTNQMRPLKSQSH